MAYKYTPSTWKANTRWVWIWGLLGLHSDFRSVRATTFGLKKGWGKPIMGLEDDSVVNSTWCSFRGLRFSSQPTHLGSQLSVAPVPRYAMFSSGLCRHKTHRECTDVYAGKISTHIKNKILIKKEADLVYSLVT